MKEEIKTLKEMNGLEMPEGFLVIEGIDSNLGKLIPEKDIRAEAVKRVKGCDICKLFKGVSEWVDKGKRCVACERDIWFHDLTEEDLR